MGKMRDVAVVSEEDKGFKTVLLGICHNLWRRLGVIGYGVMQLTSSRNPQLEAQRRQNARPESLMMAKVNQERLAEYLGELQWKEDQSDR
ncbi:hypothetical protein GOBAR_AA10124 [Gossypium barbadense]|uniref:Uncharacterized protein n=1 Tax=Gossypium barbadense TaxID=3634 RepID=A0A2P5Y4S5_GOSBA|nr:hypothetical protein GOBAR_AA10124 [Gossypium barbadense]